MTLKAILVLTRFGMNILAFVKGEYLTDV